MNKWKIKITRLIIVATIGAVSLFLSPMALLAQARPDSSTGSHRFIEPYNLRWILISSSDVFSDLEIAWEAPSRTKESAAKYPVRGYRVRRYNSSNWHWNWHDIMAEYAELVDVSSATTTYTISDLVGLGNNYRVMVAALYTDPDDKDELIAGNYASLSVDSLGSPRPPKNIRLTEVDETEADDSTGALHDGASALRIEWEAPSELARHSVAGYHVRWKKTHSSSTVRDKAYTADTAYTIPHLHHASEYEVQVAAHYRTTGNGVTGMYASKTITLGSLLLPPQNVRVTSGDGKLHVTWAPPLNTVAGKTYYYQVRWNSLGWILRADGSYGEDSFYVWSARSPYLLTGLTNGVTYVVKISAYSGTDRSSDIVFATGVPLARSPTVPPPGRPQIVQIRSGEGHDGNGLYVEWKDPPGEDYGQASYYHLRWRKVGDVGFALNDQHQEVYFAGYPSNHSITGLNRGSAYEVQIAAQNAAGKSSYTAVEYKVHSRPGAPQALKVTAGSDRHSLIASWEPPAPDSGQPVYFYHLRWKKENASRFALDDVIAVFFDPGDSTLKHSVRRGRTGPTEPVSVTGSKITETINELDSNTTYVVRVDAEGASYILMHSPEKQATTNGIPFKLDINGDGVVNLPDGILLSRYLLGVRGAALVDGQTSKTHKEIEALIQDSLDNGRLNVAIKAGEKPTWRDGIEVVKHLLGIRTSAP